MSNSINFVGNLGNDAELKHIGENTVLEFSIANSVGFGDRKTTNWFRCSLWGRQATSLEPFLRRGKQVFISGELVLRAYTNKEGVEKTSFDIRVSSLDLVGSREDVGSAPSSSPAPSNSPAPAAAKDEEEDMPF